MQSKIESKSGQLITKISDKFGLPVLEYLQSQKGYRNESHPVLLADGKVVNIMIFKGGDGVARNIQISNGVSCFLADNGMPARKSIDGRILSVSSGINQKYASLYNFLPGNTIAWEAYTQKHIKLLGKTMGDMHNLLQDYDTAKLPSVADIYTEIVHRMTQYFRQPGVTHALDMKLSLRIDQTSLKKFEAVLRRAKHLRYQQALHLDFVRSNILFRDSDDGLVISGILDFEKVARGNPLFDIARTLAFLLVDCKYKSSETVRKYFLFSGYQKRSAARLHRVQISYGGQKISLLEPLVDLFLHYDLYKFLRYNPYEDLYKNEHFIRTREILLQRNIIFLAKTADK